MLLGELLFSVSLIIIIREFSKEREENMGKLKDILEKTVEALKKNPEMGLKTIGVNTRLMEDYKCDVRAGAFQFFVDEAESMGGTNAGTNPIVLLLASIATCLEITFRVYSKLLGIEFDALSIDAEGDIDIRGFFGVDDSVRPGFSELRLKIKITTNASDSQLKQLSDMAQKHCPVTDIITNSTKVSTTITREEQAPTQKKSASSCS